MNDLVKEKLIQNMVNNLPTLRAKIGLSQEKLAEIVGVSRTTMTNIENKKRTMSWTIFLSLLFIFLSNDETAKLLSFFEIYTEQLINYIKNCSAKNS